MRAILGVLWTLFLAEAAFGGPAANGGSAVASTRTVAPRSRASKVRAYQGLLKAVERRDIATVKNLIKRGVDVSGSEVGGGFARVNRPIVTAAAKGRLDLVAALLDAGADPNACCCSCVAALHEAIRGGYASVVARLLDAGANPRLLYDASKSPLDLARERGSAEIVELLEKRLAQTK